MTRSEQAGTSIFIYGVIWAPIMLLVCHMRCRDVFVWYLASSSLIAIKEYSYHRKLTRWVNWNRRFWGR